MIIILKEGVDIMFRRTIEAIREVFTDEARAKEQGRNEAHDQWSAWNIRRLDAEKQGKEFNEPPPSSPNSSRK